MKKRSQNNTNKKPNRSAKSEYPSWSKDLYISKDLWSERPYFRIKDLSPYKLVIAKKGSNPGSVGFLRDSKGNNTSINILQDPESDYRKNNLVYGEMSYLKKSNWQYTPKEIENFAKKGILYSPLESGQKHAKYLQLKQENDDARKAHREKNMNEINAKTKKYGDKFNKSKYLSGKKYERQIENTKSQISDTRHLAKPPGRRISASGKIYYERRSNRSDKYQERLQYIANKFSD